MHRPEKTRDLLGFFVYFLSQKLHHRPLGYSKHPLDHSKIISSMLKAIPGEMRHSGKIKLPNNKTLVAMEGFEPIPVGSMQFRPYHVKLFIFHKLLKFAKSSFG